jgi:sulfate permease, SulP family
MICQVTMTLTSSFPMAFGMMMVENVPFMHVICNIATDAQGMGKDTFATVFVAFAISTISVGAFFYLLGHFKMGNVVYFFPKHVIVGCIGGIGIFLFTTGMEGSTNRAWKWEIEVLQEFFSFALIPLWVTSLCFELLLRLLSWKIKDPLLAPFFFVSIPFVFYIALLVLRIPIGKAHQTGWFFEGVVGDVDPFLIWELIDFRLVNWYSVLKSAPTIVALTVFSLMHVPINIPSLSVSTGYQTDMNKELKAHGISNLLSGCCGGLQNYVCYCNSVTYFKCNGGGIVSGLLLAFSSCVFFVIGPSAVVYVPRCMAGCLLMHIGTELTKEALWDSIGTFDVFEYGSVVAITIVMTAYGMTAGLALGVICATLTFTLQTSRNVPPIRAIRSACTLRSSRWRSQQMKSVLNQHSASISVVQLQGNLFFGNATLLSSKVEAMLQKARTSEAIRFVILDFTLVLAIDSSAADTIGNIYDICDRYGVRLCYSRSSKQGLPCALKLAKKIKDYVPKEKVEADIESCNIDHQKSREKKIEEKKSKMSRFDSDGQQPFREREFIIETPSSEEHEDSSSMQGITIGVSSGVHVADSLDEGLAWCEDVMIKEYLPMLNVQDPFFDQSLTLAGHRPIPAYLRQLHALCPFESADVVNRLFSKFVLETVRSGCVLWKQGDESNRAVLLCRGRLSSTLEEEGEELVIEDIPVGHLVSLNINILACLNLIVR